MPRGWPAASSSAIRTPTPTGARRQLESRPDAAALLASDGVFSMDGDVAPLRAARRRSARSQHATLMIDDAHGLGVLGADGAGSVAEADLTQRDVPILMATLGKALGVAGAFVAGSAELIDALVQNARTYIYTTAMPPALAAAARAAIDIARFEGWRRDRLARLIAHFRAGAAARGLRLMDSRTPIQPVADRLQRGGARGFRAARRRRLLRSRDPSADRAGRKGAVARHADRAARRKRYRTVADRARRGVRNRTCRARGARRHR